MNHKAEFYKKLPSGYIKCLLCPHYCVIPEGGKGICSVRKNEKGTLIAGSYGVVSAMHTDPIEKKPLYHYKPGSKIFSIGSVSCNMKCIFCQNYEISQEFDKYSVLPRYSPGEVVKKALNHKENIGIAFTYNEPTIFFEFMRDISVLAHKEGLKTVMVTNGFINQEPLYELMKFIDAFSVDLKAYTGKFYKEISEAGLEPVKETLKTLKQHNKFFEITYLVVTDLNDDPDDFTKMIDWIYKELGDDIPLHISRYFPYYKLDNDATPLETLSNLFRIAKSRLKYVYLGNVLYGFEGINTNCYKCNYEVITRNGYDVTINGLDKAGNCKKCGTFLSFEM
ncbi:MAG: AmmeMemoRadiSam system radical SAM enzyme [Bacteroidota bacterium]